MCNQIEPFLRIIDPQNDEFSESTLCRTAKANGYSFAEFTRLVSSYQSSGLKDSLVTPIQPDTYAILASALSISDVNYFQKTAHKLENLSTTRSKIPNDVILSDGSTHRLADRDFIRRLSRKDTKAAFCPHCLADGAYSRFNWHLNITTACVTHSCLLIESCDNCGHNLKIEDVIERRCPKCSFDLCKSKTITTDPSTQITLNKWLEGNSTIDTASVTSIFTAFLGLRHCINKIAFIKNLATFTSSEKDGYKENGWNHPIPVLHKINQIAVTALSDFPNSFYSFLDLFRDKNYKTATISIGLDRLYWDYIDKKWLSSDFDWLQNAFNDYLVSRMDTLDPKYVKARRIQMNPELKLRFRYLTLRMAAKEFNVQPSSLIGLTHNGYIRLKDINQEGQNGLVVLQDDVRAITQQLAKSENLQTTMSILGTGRDSVFSLIASNYLEAIRGENKDGTKFWAITQTSIAEFQKQLRQNVIVIKQSDLKDKHKFYAVLRALLRSGVDFSYLVDQIIDGKVEVFTVSGNDLKMDALYMKANTAKAIIKEIEEKTDVVSLSNVSKLLQVHPKNIKRWVDAELLSPIKKIGTCVYFLKKDIKLFEEKYLTTSEVADLLGIKIATVLDWITYGRLKPVSGPDIDGCRENRFLRTEVEKFAKEKRLTAPQMARVLGISRGTMCEWIRKGHAHPVSGPRIDGSKHYLFLAT